MIAATLIARLLMPDSLGCPPTAFAHDDMWAHARIVRLGWEDSVEARPGHQASIVFKFTARDTYAVKAWASNAAGRSQCPDLIATLQALVSLDAPDPSDFVPTRWYDLQGRRTEPRRDGVYWTGKKRKTVIR